MKFENKKKVDELCRKIENLDELLNLRENVDHVSIENFSNSIISQQHILSETPDKYQQLVLQFVTDYFALVKQERAELIKLLEEL